MTYQIRKVKPEDLNELSIIEEICFPPAEAASKESIKQRIATFPNSFYVATIDDKIVGFINGGITNEKAIFDELYTDSSLHLLDGEYQSIFGIMVLPEYRNMHIPTALMNHLIQQSKANHKKGLILTCKENLIPYYERFGYQNQGVSKSVHGGVVWYDMLLELEK